MSARPALSDDLWAPIFSSLSPAVCEDRDHWNISTPPKIFRSDEALPKSPDKAAQSHCSILITPHPSASSLFDHLGGSPPLADLAACARYAHKARQVFENRLAKEKP